MTRWAAIDFETANEQRASACSIGVVLVDGDTVVDEYVSLIRPPEVRFNEGNVRIHGIEEEDVLDAPEWHAIWEELAGPLDGCTLVAHNAGFDIGVLRAMHDVYGIEHPGGEYVCTVQLARRAWPGHRNYRLPDVAGLLGIALDHHEALSDARACAGIGIASIAQVGATDIASAAQAFNVRRKPVAADRVRA